MLILMQNALPIMLYLHQVSKHSSWKVFYDQHWHLLKIVIAQIRHKTSQFKTQFADSNRDTINGRHKTGLAN